MELRQAVQSIKSHITNGELEQALLELVAVCDADPRCGDLGEAARVSQSEYNRLKGDVLRGTVSGEDARLATNRITTRALQLVRRLETAQFDLSDDDQAPPTARRRVRWQWFAIGGVVALAAAFGVWKFMSGRAPDQPAGESCPQFKKQYTTRVMVLPFRRSGPGAPQPEYDISDNLNSLFNRTPKMKSSVLADVNERYDINANYPNPAEAEDQAQQCDVQMIVWGRINEVQGQNFRLSVFYRLLNANQLLTSGDTTISRLVTVSDQGNILRDDADAVVAAANLLYMVLATQLQADIPSAVLAQISSDNRTVATTDSMGRATVDTLASMVLAEHYIQTNQHDLALQELNTVIEAHPTYVRARMTRAALLAEDGNFEAASRDVEVAVPDPARAPVVYNQARADIFLKSGQVEKARKEIEVLGNKKVDAKWRSAKNRELADSTTALNIRREALKDFVAKNPTNVRQITNLAKTELKMGNEKAAVKGAEAARRMAPRNAEVVGVLTDALVQGGETERAKREIDKAEDAGITVKGVGKEIITVRPLQQLQKQ